jgi:pSer/pThr/pTyr-binding forkhead associated (FHA) protein
MAKTESREPVVIRLSRQGRKIVTVGRSPDCDITIDTDKISKRHAYFDQEGDGSWFVADAGSTNGTFVDGKQVQEHEHHALSDAATIRFSPDVGFRFFGPAAFFRYVSMRTRKNT